MSITLTIVSAQQDPTNAGIADIIYTRSDTGAQATLQVEVTGNAATDEATVTAALQSLKAGLNAEATEITTFNSAEDGRTI